MLRVCFVRVCSLAVVGLIPLIAYSQERTTVRKGALQPAAEKITFQAYAEISLGEVQLINGVRVDPADWKTILIAKVPLPNSTTVSCTGTLVGPGIFITAAHCLDAGANLPPITTISLSIGGQHFQPRCDLSPEYTKAIADRVIGSPRVSQDYAICHFVPPLNPPVLLRDIEYENVEMNEGFSVGSTALLTGFGCRTVEKLRKPGLPPDLESELDIGDVTISKLPIVSATIWDRFVAINSRLRSQSGHLEPGLCPGDSGGPVLSGATSKQQVAKRRVRAVNVGVRLLEDSASGTTAVSYVAPLATDAFRAFVNHWLQKNNGRTICGINGQEGFAPCRE